MSALKADMLSGQPCSPPRAASASEGAAIPNPKLKTCKRFDIPGHAHELTFTCFHGLPLLSRDRARQWLVDAIGRARDRHEFDIWAYVIMPEHVHLLVFHLGKSY